MNQFSIRVISLWACAGLMLMAPINAFSELHPFSTYSDVPRNTPLYTQLMDLKNRYHLAPITEDSQFKPDAPVTHLQFASQLNNTLDSILDMSKGELYAIQGLPVSTQKTGNVQASLKKLEAAKTDKAYYTVLRTLIKRHGVDLPQNLKTFKPDALLTQTELATLTQGLFKDTLYSQKGKQVVTRAQLAEFLYMVLTSTEQKMAPVLR